MRFKVGDKVKFIKKTTGSLCDPEIGSIHTIMMIDIENREFPYIFKCDTQTPEYSPYRFGENEIISANSDIIKERLGVK